MKVKVTPFVISALGTVTKGLVEDLEIRGPVEAIQTIALLRSARTLQKVAEIQEEESININKRKMYKYLDLARGFKKLGNMKIKVILIVVGELGEETEEEGLKL